MIPSDNAGRYLEEAAICDLMVKYQSLGYSPVSERAIGDLQVKPDLILEKGGKKLVLEVVVRGQREQAQVERVRQLKKLLDSIQPAEFKTVFVSPPKRTAVEVEGLQDILAEQLENEGMPEIGNGVRLEEVSDVEIDDVTVTRQAIHVTGSFVVSVSILFGPSRDGIEVDESFPGTFNAELDHDLQPIEVNCSVDTSAWEESLYEDAHYDVEHPETDH